MTYLSIDIYNLLTVTAQIGLQRLQLSSRRGVFSPSLASIVFGRLSIPFLQRGAFSTNTSLRQYFAKASALIAIFFLTFFLLRFFYPQFHPCQQVSEAAGIGDGLHLQRR